MELLLLLGGIGGIAGAGEAANAGCGDEEGNHSSPGFH